MKEKLKYFKQLDGLRAIAAISVVTFHFIFERKFSDSIWERYSFLSFTDVLQHGVTLFFVLSGFVITRILINTKEQQNYFYRFYKNRILRIFPLYYLYLIITYFVFPFIQGKNLNFDFQRQLPFYFFLQNMHWLTNLDSVGPGHFWSLAVEEHFYLLWPIIVFLTPLKKLKLVTLSLITISLPIKFYFVRNNIDINYNSFSRFDSILIGSFISILEFNLNFKLKKTSNFFFLFMFSILLFLGGILYLFQDSLMLYKSIFKHLILGMFFGFVIYNLISFEDSKINKLLKSIVMQYLGKISFGIYVWHILAFQITLMFSFSSVLSNFLISIFLTIILAHISYFYFEKRFLALK